MLEDPSQLKLLKRVTARNPGRRRHVVKVEGTIPKGLIHFEVPGHPIGYYAEGKIANWDRAKQYHDYCKKVREYAVLAGIQIPMDATKAHPVTIHTTSWFKNGVHSDPGSVQKGVVDALFYGGGSDKFTGGSFRPPFYDAEDPRCEITIDARLVP